MSYTSRYSGSYSSRYGDSSSRYGDSTSRYGDPSSRYGDSTRDYTSRYGDYSSRYTGKDSSSNTEFGGSSYSSRYRSKEPCDTNVEEAAKETTPDVEGVECPELDYSALDKTDRTEVAVEDDVDEIPQDNLLELDAGEIDCYGGDEEGYPLTPNMQDEVVKDVEETAKRSLASSGSTSPIPSSEEEAKEGLVTIHHSDNNKEKLAPPAPSDNPEHRSYKIPIEQAIPSKRVSDLIARFNKGSAESDQGWKPKNDYGAKSIGKIHSNVFH